MGSGVIEFERRREQRRRAGENIATGDVDVRIGLGRVCIDHAIGQRDVDIDEGRDAIGGFDQLGQIAALLAAGGLIGLPGVGGRLIVNFYGTVGVRHNMAVLIVAVVDDGDRSVIGWRGGWGCRLVELQARDRRAVEGDGEL